MIRRSGSIESGSPKPSPPAESISPDAASGALVGELLTRCTFGPADTAVTCAVSGGADSLSLLVLAVAHGCRVTAVHVDHGLRPGSAREADVVAAAAERFGADFRAERIDVTPGPNLEARARRSRYDVLPPGTLTGHTADDQAETMLINLIRGAGLYGAVGMQPSTRRPILGLRRTETVQLCAALGLEPVDDPSNRDPRFVRNRIRHEAIPLLDDIAGRDLVPLLTRHSALLSEAVEFIESLAAEIDVTDARVLREAPEPVAAAAIRAWLRADVDDLHPPDAATIGRVLSVARGDATATEIGGGRRVARTAGVLRIET